MIKDRDNEINNLKIELVEKNDLVGRYEDAFKDMEMRM